MDSKKTKNTYFENVSRAFADLCGEFATVMTADPTPGNIPKDGIWGRIEQVELERTSGFDSPKQQVDFVRYLASSLHSCRM